MIIFHRQCTLQKNTREVAKSLKEISKMLIEWFKNSKMKVNPDKYHSVLSGNDIKTINVGIFTIKCTKSEKLLGVTFDNKANIQSHIESLYSKADRKLHALARVAPYLDL